MYSELTMAAILDFRSPGSKVKAIHWHTSLNYFIAPTPETVYKAAHCAAQSIQIVKIIFKKAMAAILDFG